MQLWLLQPYLSCESNRIYPRSELWQSWTMLSQDQSLPQSSNFSAISSLTPGVCAAWSLCKLSVCQANLLMIMMRGLLCPWYAKEGSRTLHSSLTALFWLTLAGLHHHSVSITSPLWSCAKCQPSYSQLVTDSEGKIFCKWACAFITVSFVSLCVWVCACRWVCTCLTSNQQWFKVAWGAKGICPWHV